MNLWVMLASSSDNFGVMMGSSWDNFGIVLGIILGLGLGLIWDWLGLIPQTVLALRGSYGVGLEWGY